MKQKLLIIDKHQFGYITDIYKWCQYLCNEYDIEVITSNVGNQIIDLPDVKVHYISFKLPRILRAFVFIAIALLRIYQYHGKIIIEYFQYCSILKKLCPWKKMIVDVRTLSVNPDPHYRTLYNARLIRDCKYFDTISVISYGVAKQIGLNNINILPLGSDIISSHPKKYTDEIKLLYVGTLRWRNIERTIEGLKIFTDAFPDVKISYTIIGDGIPGQLDTLKQLAKHLKLDHKIIFTGQIPLNKLKSYFDTSNVGVSFIPITEYYDHQPPTKTFEYILSGLYCIATATSANKALINSDNGCLINDSAESFASGIEHFIKYNKDINESRLRNSLSEYTWPKIIQKQLINILNSI